MALFKKEKSEKKKYFSSATIITQGTTSIGNFIGNDSIHIDGHVKGDVKVNNVVIVGTSGTVDGDIKAQQVISSGNIEGDIICDSLELLETSKSQSQIKANKVLAKGTIIGDIACSGLFVSENAMVESNIQAKNITSGGTIVGKLACKVLKIESTSCIKGSMFADRIINEGGHVEGYIGQYSDALIDNPQLGFYGAILNSKKNIPLLEKLDYHVDIEEEIQSQATTSCQENRTDDAYIDVELETEEELCKTVMV